MHDHVLTVGVSIGPLLLRIALLAGVPAAAGFALLRVFLPEPGRYTTACVAVAASAALVAVLMLADRVHLPPQVVALLLLAALAAPPLTLVRHRVADVARACAPWVLGVAATYALVEFAVAWLRAWPPGQLLVLVHTGLACGLAGLGWAALCRPRSRRGAVAVHATAMVLAVAVTGGLAHLTLLTA